ncbi:MAG: DNA-processing protein DprA [Candidatus Sericytochromatia bacterium]
MELREKVFRVALNHFPEVGAVRTRILLEAFGSIEAAWQARADEIAVLPRFGPKVAKALQDFCRKHEPEDLYQQVLDKDLQLVFLGEPDYPPLLANIYDPPYLLYWRGQPSAWRRLSRCVAIVGTREATSYGLKIARRLGETLAQAGVTVVSGMALGIDAAAHEGALATSGLTVAVLGSGVDVPSPLSHKTLYQKIVSQGLVISELPPGHPPQTWTFPMRNRLVSGLSQGLIVVEAGLKSGTLITVDCANEQGREVFAVPGSISSPQSSGTHALIQQGAHLLTHPDEVLTALGWLSTPSQPASAPVQTALPLEAIGLTKAEEQVYVLLSEQPRHIDALVSQSEQEPQQFSGILTLLELKGLAEQLPGKLYKKKSHF